MLDSIQVSAQSEISHLVVARCPSLSNGHSHVMGLSQPDGGARASMRPWLDLFPPSPTGRYFASRASSPPPSFHHHHFFGSSSIPSIAISWLSEAWNTFSLHVFTCCTCSLHAIAVRVVKKPVWSVAEAQFEQIVNHHRASKPSSAPHLFSFREKSYLVFLSSCSP